jgi:hypothetical protein
MKTVSHKTSLKVKCSFSVDFVYLWECLILIDLLILISSEHPVFYPRISAQSLPVWSGGRVPIPKKTGK